jgi:hypothetical protein
MACIALLLLLVLERGGSDKPSGKCCVLCSSSEWILARGCATTTWHLPYPQRCTVAGSTRRASIQRVIQRDSRRMCACLVAGLPNALPSCPASARACSSSCSAFAASSSTCTQQQQQQQCHVSKIWSDVKPDLLPPLPYLPPPANLNKIETVIQGRGRGDHPGTDEF